MKLAIIVGHSKAHPGARAMAPIGCHEYEWNCDVAEDVRQTAVQRGLRAAIFLRDGKSIEAIGGEVNNWASDDVAVAVELHFNAAGGKGRGTETLYDMDPPESKLFAEAIHKEVCKALGREFRGDRGVRLIEKGDRGHRNLSSVIIPSALLEPGFGDDVDDSTIMFNTRDEYVVAIVDAAYKFMKEWNV